MLGSVGDMPFLFDLEAIKPWIEISPLDQTKFDLIQTALLCECMWVHENKTVGNQMKPRDIENWYYHTTFETIHQMRQENTFPIKESSFTELLR